MFVKHGFLVDVSLLRKEKFRLQAWKTRDSCSFNEAKDSHRMGSPIITLESFENISTLWSQGYLLDSSQFLQET